jgi:ubiquinone biosynthesis protein UbiJ
MSGGVEKGDLGERVEKTLQPSIGDFVARMAVRMARKKIGKAESELTAADLPPLAEALQPALRTLLGNQAADALVEQVRSCGSAERCSQ